MPRTLPTGVQAAVSTDQYRACLCVKIGTSTPILVTNSPTSVTVGSDTYLPGFLVLGQTLYDDAPAISVRLANTGNEITSVDLDGSAQGGVIGKSLTVLEVVYDSGGTQLSADTLYAGVVAALTADAASAQLTGTLAELCTAGMVCLVSSRLCGYRFKGSRCGYAGGGTSCDHTYANCTTLSNTARFGGWRTMPTLNTKLLFYLSEWVPGAVTFGTSVPPSAPQPPAPDVPRQHLQRGGPGRDMSADLLEPSNPNWKRNILP